MNTEWDGGDIAFRPDVWLQCLRVLKPGGYMVAFAGCRTQHRMVCAIEDAGFIIHPQLIWCFSSGFPKAANASKMIDKHLGKEREVVGVAKGAGMSGKRPDVGVFRDDGWQPAGSDLPITAPASPEAAQWEGWAYGLQSLKPAYEPICLAQKPMIGTGAENLLKHGVGALNIDACRVVGKWTTWRRSDGSIAEGGQMPFAKQDHARNPEHASGRWPPNFLHDGSDEVVSLFPQTHGSHNQQPSHSNNSTFVGSGVYDGNGYCDEGSAARFFPGLGYSEQERRLMYCPKASKKDRAGSKHPTVKPLKLLEWLCRLVCPLDGTILDPFAGSGTTGEAASRCGFNAILIEQDDEYIKDINRRIASLYIGQPTG